MLSSVSLFGYFTLSGVVMLRLLILNDIVLV